MRSRSVLGFILLIILITLPSCDGCSDKNPASGSATLSLNIKMPESYSKKSAVSGSNAMVSGVTGIKVTLNSPGKETIVVDVPVDTGKTAVSIIPGTWTISVVVTTEEGLTFTGSTIIDIVSGQIKEATVPVDVNRSPVIERMWADSTSLFPGESTTVHVRATDKDGDSLSYSCGGPDFTWTAPATPGDHRVSCSIDDGHGGIATSSTVIEVKGTTESFSGTMSGGGAIYLSLTGTITGNWLPDGIFTINMNGTWSTTGPPESTFTGTISGTDSGGGTFSGTISGTWSGGNWSANISGTKTGGTFTGTMNGTYTGVGVGGTFTGSGSGTW